MKEYNRLYPQLAKEGNGKNFRLKRSCEILQSLEDEIKHNESTRKKSTRLRKLIVETTGGISVLLSGTGLALSLTGFGASVGAPISAVGALFGVVSATSKVKLSQKITKHAETIQLAKAKVNALYDIVSRALNDNKISEQEFSLDLSPRGERKQHKARY